MRATWLLLAGVAVTAPLFAQTATTVAVPGDATAQGDVAVTIYQNGQSLVQDRRQMTMPAGRSKQEFPDVSAVIRPETVLRKPANDLAACAAMTNRASPRLRAVALACPARSAEGGAAAGLMCATRYECDETPFQCGPASDRPTWTADT